jgi:hypothetical protein
MDRSPLRDSAATNKQAATLPRLSSMDTDSNFVFGVLALQADLLDNARFAEAFRLGGPQRDAAG